MNIQIPKVSVWHKDGFKVQDTEIPQRYSRDTAETKSLRTLREKEGAEWFLIPAICDFHVHIGETIGGYTLADDYLSYGNLAKAQGIAAIGAFITERKDANNNYKSLKTEYIRRNKDVEQTFPVHVHWHLTPTISTPEDVYPLLEMGCDLKFYTTYKEAGLFRSYEEIEQWMQALIDLKPRILVHCEDDALISECSANHPFKHPLQHTLRRPELAEIKAVERVLDLAVKYHYPVHIVHVSSPVSAQLISEAKKSAPVTCETALHYLLLNDDYLKREDGHHWLCSPPIRSEKTRGQLVELLQDDYFDILASDHCPFTKEDKDRYIDTPELVPNGIAGSGAMFTLLYEELVKKGKISLTQLVQLICTNPANLMKLPADISTFDSNSKYPYLLFRQNSTTDKYPIIPSFSNTHNPWIDYYHQIDYWVI